MKRLLAFSFLILFFPGLAKASCFKSGNAIQQLGELKTILSCFEAEIQSLKKQLKQGGAETITIKTVLGLPEPTVSASTVSERFKSELFNCKRKLDVVRCSFQITNRKEDDDFYFNHDSRAFDEIGGEYKPGLIEVGGVSTDLREEFSIEKHLISGLPTRGRIEFYGVSKERSRFAAINISVSSQMLKFRNVVILEE